jgi:hypothetical protein
MANPWHHSVSSARKYGGTPEEYLHLHEWFDKSKEMFADSRHRALRHHAEGIFMLAYIFGPTLTLSTGKTIPTRWIGEQHVKEDLGFIPSIQDWFSCIHWKPWMRQPPVVLEKKLEETDQPIDVPERIPTGWPTDSRVKFQAIQLDDVPSEER